MNPPHLVPFTRMHGLGDTGQDVHVACVLNGMHGVQPETIQVILHHPIQGVVNEEVAHPFAVWSIESDCSAPRGVSGMVEELVPGVGVEVISFRPEVVVDHIQKDHQPPGVAGIHKGLPGHRAAP